MLAAKSFPRTNFISVLMALGSAVIWSTTPVVVKIGLGYLGPFTIAALRFLLSGLILLPFVLRESGGLRGLRAYPRAYLRAAVIMGLCAHLLGDGLSYLSLTSLSASTVGFLNILVPVIPVLIGVVWLRERPDAGQVIGALLVLLGSAGFIYPFKLEAGQPLGLALLLASLLAVGVYVVISRVTGRGGHLPTLTMTGVAFLAGGFALGIAALALEGLPRLTWQGALVVGWLTLFNSIIAFLLYNTALKHMTILETNAVMGLVPVASTLLSVVVLGDRFGLAQGIAVVVVLGGIALVQMTRKAEADSPQRQALREDRIKAKP